MTKLMTGQVLLIICCVFYLIWWSISYRPGVSVNRTGGVNGVLLLITALSGITGMILTIYGENTIPAVNAPKLHGVIVVAAGIAAYLILLPVTRYVFSRPVTTELVLITGWVILELTSVNSLNAGGKLSNGRFYISCGIIAAAFIISLVLYILYYKMEPMKAFYAAMVPLITEGVSMILIVLMTIV